jgi:predicted KAP-like P-loop ATPase
MFFHFLEKENNIQNKVLSLVRDTLKDCAKEYIVDKIPIFKNYINSKESIEKKSSEKQKQLFNILELKQKMIQNAENIKDNIFIFIDDLDRCNPNFVIKLIELTKHIFNIKNITIVYMLD